MLVAAAHIHANQFGASIYQNAHFSNVAGLYCFREPGYIRAVNESLEFGPALETVGARQHTLGVMQGERCRIGLRLELVYLSDGCGVAGAILLQQVLGLLAQLFEVWLLRQPPRLRRAWEISGHDDLLSSHCPASA